MVIDTVHFPHRKKEIKGERMTDAECLKIEMSAWAYLIRCAFDDWAITTSTSKALKQLRKELQ